MPDAAAGGPSRSAAWRLAAPATVAFAVGSAVVLLAAYAVILRQSGRELDAVLGSAAADLAAEVPGAGTSGLPDWLAEERADLVRYFARSRASDGASPPEVVLVALDAGGRPTAWAGVATPDPLLASLPQRPAGAGGVERFRAPGFPRPLRAVVQRGAGGTGLVLAVDEPEARPLLRRIALTLVALWAAVVAIGATVAWWGVRGTLRRVERLTRAAAAIDHPESGRRLVDSGDRDEIARLAATLNHMLDRIAATVAEIRDVTQDAAHDLRTPLTAVRGRLEMALAAPGGDWQGEVAEAIEGLDRLAAMLQAILDVSEAEGSALELRRESVDLAALCRDLVELYAPAAQEHGLELIADAPGRVDLRVDSSLVQRAMGNLLDNALHHVPAGCRVVVAVRRLPRGGAEILVEDDGEGFSEAVAARAFERSVRRPGSPGLGLGLALVRAVARAHGGEARLGRGRLGGATVALRFPPVRPQPMTDP